MASLSQRDQKRIVCLIYTDWKTVCIYMKIISGQTMISLDPKTPTITNLVFEFEVSYKKWNVKGCGVQLLREEESADDDDGGGDNDDFEYDTEDEDDEFGDGDNDDFEDDIEDEENEDDEVGDDDNEEDNVDNIQKGEEAGREEDAETRSRKRMRFSLWQVLDLRSFEFNQKYKTTVQQRKAITKL